MLTAAPAGDSGKWMRAGASDQHLCKTQAPGAFREGGKVDAQGTQSWELDRIDDSGTYQLPGALGNGWSFRSEVRRLGQVGTLAVWLKAP